MKSPFKRSFFQWNQQQRLANRFKTGGVLGVVLLVVVAGLWGLKQNNNHSHPHLTVTRHLVQFVGPMSQDYESKSMQSALLDQQLQGDKTAQQAKQLAHQLAQHTQQLAQLTQQIHHLEMTIHHQSQSSLVRHRSVAMASSPHLVIHHTLPMTSIREHHTSVASPQMLPAVYTPLVMPHAKPYHDVSHENDLVPSGTFVRAVMLSGADANASVNGEKNTDPVLLRILDQGTLPNGHHSALTGCFVTASIFGDISSERGQIRTDRLSCVRPNHQLLDIHVQGTVVGSGGKNGLRGIPVMRNGKILWNASIAGGLSGLGQAAQTSQESHSTSPLGAVTNMSGNVLTYAATGGMKSAAEHLAHYYVQRAEQYHPVIQINPGSVVTIIFLKPFSLSTDQPLSGLATPPVESYSPDQQDPTGVRLTSQQRTAYLQSIHQVSLHHNPLIQQVSGISSSSFTSTGGH